MSAVLAPATVTGSKRSIALDRASHLRTLVAAGLCLLPLLLRLSPQVALALAAVGIAITALSWQRPIPGWLRLILAVSLLAGVLFAHGMQIGRDTGAAVLAAMLAIKPAETRSLRDARSLLGFALFAPFATFLLDQGPLSMLLSLLGVMAALLAMQRLADQESGIPAPAGRIALGEWRPILRLLLIGMPLALAAFWLFPRLGSPLWGMPERAMAKTGLSDRMTPGEWIDLMGDESPALRVNFIGTTPPQSQMYWRGPVLSLFDGRSWTRAEWLSAVAAPPITLGQPTWQYVMDVEPTDTRQLVALEMPPSVPENVFSSAEASLYVPRPLTGVTRWRMEARPVQSFQPELNRFAERMHLALPEGFNPRTVALARQWRQQAGNDDEAVIRRAMDMIHADFIYTVDTPLLGRDSVDEFLFDVKAGFCEHYSSAFVVLMRAAGIPARVVTGYVGGVYNRMGDYWLVRRSDAHAWAEVWLPERGWVRMDPTAAVAPERIYDTIADRTPGAIGGFTGLTPAFEAGDWLRRGWNDMVLGFNAERQQALLRGVGLDAVDTSSLIAIFAVVVILVLAWMAWLLARSERERDPLLRAWHGLGKRYARAGLARAPHEPALHWAERVVGERPAAHGLLALSQRFNDSRYASPMLDADARRALIHALRRHRP